MRYLYLCIVVGLMAFSQSIFADEILEEIRVTSHPLSQDGLAQSSTVLSGDELARKIRGSLGDTLADEVGIRSASFGSAVGRPVIHGLGGARVKTTEDRIDSLDVSVTSGDHAVSIEPFIANKITVLKGASTLLYGSNAIGGVVDVETGRIPKQEQHENLSGRLELRTADSADTITGALRLDGKWSDALAWHVDAFARDADNYTIPGSAESAILRQNEGEEHNGDNLESSTLTGSHYQNTGGAIGSSLIGDRGFIGFSISTLDAEYGLVGGHEDEPAEQSLESGFIDLGQTRFDIEAELNSPFSSFEAINFRVGVNDYQHQEIETNGEVGTVFNNDAWESRIELVHNPLGGFIGTLGLHLNRRDFSAIGEEAFVQPVESESVGVFWVGEKNFAVFDLETGIRYEKLQHQPSEPGFNKQIFSSLSSSLGAIVPISNRLSVATLIDYTSRAPSIEELFSNGPHLATQSFEIGDVDLNEETATGISITGNYETSLVGLSGTFYRLRFDDFIYQSALGEQRDELPVFLYKQQDATFTGVDAKADIHLGDFAGGDLDLSLLFDIVRAKLKGNGIGDRNLPRIPTTRYSISLEWTNSLWTFNANVSRIAAQRDTAIFELATAAYDDVSIYLSRKIERANTNFEIFLHGKNLGDDEQRHHVSFVKDIAPAPGRRFELGLRWQF